MTALKGYLLHALTLEGLSFKFQINYNLYRQTWVKNQIRNINLHLTYNLEMKKNNVTRITSSRERQESKEVCSMTSFTKELMDLMLS